MSSTLFCIPLKKGKTEAYKAFLKDCVESKRSDYKDLLKRYGLNLTKVWIHTIDSKDYAMYIHEMHRNARELLKGWSTSTHPFDQWFNKQLHEYYDIQDFDNLPPQPQFLGEINANLDF